MIYVVADSNCTSVDLLIYIYIYIYIYILYIYIYIYIYILSKHHNTKICIYFIFAMQLNIGIDSVYQVGLFGTFSNCHNYVYAVIYSSLISIELWDWLKCIGYTSLNVRKKVPCYYPFALTRWALVENTTLKTYLGSR